MFLDRVYYTQIALNTESICPHVVNNLSWFDVDIFGQAKGSLTFLLMDQNLKELERFVHF